MTAPLTVVTVPRQLRHLAQDGGLVSEHRIRRSAGHEPTIVGVRPIGEPSRIVESPNSAARSTWASCCPITDRAAPKRSPAS